jgi:hypothetical protein
MTRDVILAFITFRNLLVKVHHMMHISLLSVVFVLPYLPSNAYKIAVIGGGISGKSPTCGLESDYIIIFAYTYTYTHIIVS